MNSGSQPAIAILRHVEMGEVVVMPKNKRIADLAGILGKPPIRQALTLEDIDDAIGRPSRGRRANRSRVERTLRQDGMIGVDTNVLLRFDLATTTEQFTRASALVEQPMPTIQPVSSA